MNWRSVLAMGAAFGLMTGYGGVMGWPGWLGTSFSIAVVVVCAIIVARTEQRAFVSGFFAGVLIGVVQTGLVLAFWGQFLANHSWFVAWEQSKTPLFEPRMFCLIGSISSLIIYGLSIGLLAMLLRKLAVGHDDAKGGAAINIE